MSPETLEYLLTITTALSGLPGMPLADLPVIERVAPAALVREVCPDDPANCRGIAAYFDRGRYRILVSTKLDLEEPEGSSYLVHELVHALQYRDRGDGMFATCEDALASEAEAYRVQDLYLHRSGVQLRVGAAIDDARCEGDGRLRASLR